MPLDRPTPQEGDSGDAVGRLQGTWSAVQGRTPTVEGSVDLAASPSWARVVAHAQDRDTNGCPADLGIADLDSGDLRPWSSEPHTGAGHGM